MKRSFKQIGIIAGAIASALIAAPQAVTVVHAGQVQEQKAARIESRIEKKLIIDNHHSGMDIATYWPNVGLSPKEYGQLYGCKKHSKKSNRNRLSHNAKVRRR
jgi:hypothetical protein